MAEPTEYFPLEEEQEMTPLEALTELAEAAKRRNETGERRET